MNTYRSKLSVIVLCLVLMLVSLSIFNSDPVQAAYLGEVRIFPLNFAPAGWASCDGQILPINQNQALYSLLGTTYGGDGRTTFALPDLRGRVAMHEGNGHPLGEKGGEEAHTLLVNELPTHSHVPASKNTGTTDTPGPDTYQGKAQTLDRREVNVYSSTPDTTEPSTSTGGPQAHENMQPYLTLNFCIAVQGEYPTRE